MFSHLIPLQEQIPGPEIRSKRFLGWGDKSFSSRMGVVRPRDVIEVRTYRRMSPGERKEGRILLAVDSVAAESEIGWANKK